MLLKFHNFEGRGPTHEKWRIKTSYKKTQLVNIVFQSNKWRKYCGKFTYIGTLKTNGSYCYCHHRRGGNERLGATPPENFRNHTFSILGKHPFDIERALQKGYFCSSAEKGRGLDPLDPLVARLLSGLLQMDINIDAFAFDCDNFDASPVTFRSVKSRANLY